MKAHHYGEKKHLTGGGMDGRTSGRHVELRATAPHQNCGADESDAVEFSFSVDVIMATWFPLSCGEQTKKSILCRQDLFSKLCDS